MTTRRLIPVLLVAGSLAAVGASVAWAVSAAAGAKPSQRPAPGTWMMGHLPAAQGKPVTGLTDAEQRARAFAARLGLDVGEVLRFQRNFHVTLVDRAGDGAAEVLVEPESGAVSLEYGPAMMWNTRYGMMSGRVDAAAMHAMMGDYGADMMGGTHMMSRGGMMAGAGGMMGGGMMGGGAMMGGGGMMGGAGPAVPAPQVSPGGTDGVTLAEARALAQAWLDANEPGVEAETGGDVFPGYFTWKTMRAGTITGMISVNGSTGGVWPHWWHGDFVAAST